MLTSAASANAPVPGPVIVAPDKASAHAAPEPAPPEAEKINKVLQITE